MSSEIIAAPATTPTAEAELTQHSPSTTVSVVICTRNRPDTIVRAVESVLRQTYERFDILVVDQSETDETRRLVEELMARSDRVRYRHLDRAGAARARNAGMYHTTGELIAFMDDDCEAHERWLDTIVRCFAAHPDISLLYGQVLLPPALQQTGTPGGIIPTLLIPQRQRLSRRDGFKIFGMSANLAGRRAMCERVGGFDEMLGAGGPLKSGEDFDFTYRVYRAGGTILLEPDLIVYHYGFRSSTEWPTQLRAYGFGDGAFYFKHIRAGDLYAVGLLSRALFIGTARELKHTILPGNHGAEWSYVSNILPGIRSSLKFGVDRRQRRYVVR